MKFRQFRVEYIQEKLEKISTPDSPTGGILADMSALNITCDLPSKTEIPAYQVGDVLTAFLDHAKWSFPAEQYGHFRLAAKWVLKSGYGDCPVNEFTPKKLKAVRENMIKGGTLCRKQINAYKNYIIRFFRWAGEEEMLDKPDVVTALRCVRNLRKGEFGTRDNPKTVGVPYDVVLRTLPFLLPIIQAMVRGQSLFGQEKVAYDQVADCCGR